MTAIQFISDLHLDATRPAATAAFLRYLRGDARHAGTLFILGDLFEFWIGDDSNDQHSVDVLGAIREYTGTGRQCLVMRGNRDFLLGARFTQRTGADLLEEPEVREIFGARVLIMHGDLLCTDDHAYLRYRRVVQNPYIQRVFLALPRFVRRRIGTEGRRRSRNHAARTLPQIMDVNQDAVCAAIAASGASVILHGHTHRPGIHRVEMGSTSATRIVLGAWYDHGSVLTWSPTGYELKTIALD